MLAEEMTGVETAYASHLRNAKTACASVGLAWGQLREDLQTLCMADVTGDPAQGIEGKVGDAFQMLALFTAGMSPDHKHAAFGDPDYAFDAKEMQAIYLAVVDANAAATQKAYDRLLADAACPGNICHDIDELRRVLKSYSVFDPGSDPHALFDRTYGKPEALRPLLEAMAEGTFAHLSALSAVCERLEGRLEKGPYRFATSSSPGQLGKLAEAAEYGPAN